MTTSELDKITKTINILSFMYNTIYYYERWQGKLPRPIKQPLRLLPYGAKGYVFSCITFE